MSMLQPEFKPLIEILDHKLFKIPEYQRHYSWQSKQRNDLFLDIKTLEEKRKKYEDRIHFMATIVCLKTREKEQVGSNTFQIYEVVDGQQRLTTLVILLKAISIKLQQNGQINESNEIDRLLVKDDRRLIILQNNHDNLSLLRNYLVYCSRPDLNSIKTLADHNLSQAIKECERFVNSIADPINLLSLIKNYLYFVFQSLDDEGAVYTIFEVLNSRGLEVDWLDKCKSLLMGLLYEYSKDIGDNNTFHNLIDELHGYWSQIYREIGLQQIRGHEIVQCAATLKTESDAGSPLSPEDALDFFKKECTKPTENSDKIDKIINYTIWLTEITSCLSKLYADKTKSAVTEITHARLLAVAIMQKRDISEYEKQLLLDQWERTSFKIYGLFRRDSRTKRGDFVRVAKKIVRKESGKKVMDLVKSIAEIGYEFPIDKAVGELIKNDYYNDWQKELRYFFYKYEEHLSKNSGVQLNQTLWKEIWESNVNDTIEHILPQDRSNSDWNHFKASDHKELVHTLGNLCLLSPRLNREASNNGFKDKKKTYKKASLRLIDEIIFHNETERIVWDKISIQKRSEWLLKFAIEQWKDL